MHRPAGEYLPPHVFDLSVQTWRRKRAHGDVIVVRYADDIVVGFEFKDVAEPYWSEPEERMDKFQLELHSEKTQLIEFRRRAASYHDEPLASRA